MFTVEMRVGRLMEFRFEGEVSEAEVKALRSRVGELLVRAGQTVVACVDARRCTPIQGDTGMVVGLMRADNRALERSAVVITEGTVVGQQLASAIAEAKNPARRTFTSVAEAVTFLSSVLTPAESERLKAFYGEAG
jgi:hypothetical protein